MLAIDWLPRGMCVNWNELQYLLACATASRNQVCNAAMNGFIRHWRALYLPYIDYSYHGTQVMCDNWNELSLLACATV